MFLFLIFLCWGVNAAPNATYYNLEDAAILFEEFIRTYDKQYANEQEKETRLEIFKQNLEDSNKLNNKSELAYFGITQFMDLTVEEFQHRYACMRDAHVLDTSCPYKTDSDIPNSGAPESWDWREQGIVTPVKSQGTCGSCYAFSAIGVVEGQYAKTRGQLQEFSEQQIVDCDTKSNGCDNGRPSYGLETLMQEGAMTEQDYPYQGVRQQCRADPSRAVARVTSCSSYNLASQETVKQLVYAAGPIAIGVQSYSLHKYQRGILKDQDCNIGPVDHAVLLVGYGAETGMPYWIIKNSWGLVGEGGYVRIQRNGSPGASGACGLLNNGMASATVG